MPEKTKFEILGKTLDEIKNEFEYIIAEKLLDFINDDPVKHDNDARDIAGYVLEYSEKANDLNDLNGIYVILCKRWPRVFSMNDEIPSSIRITVDAAARAMGLR